MTIPNFLSLVRIFLVPPFVIALIYDEIQAALGLFLLAGITDFLDGFIARRFGQKSLLGTYLDPVGDKMLTTAAFVALSVKGLLPAWLAVVVVAKDIYIIIGAAILYFSGQGAEPEVSSWGKLCTFLQIVTVALALISAIADTPFRVLPTLFLATAVATAVAGVHYIWHGIRSIPLKQDEEPG